MSNFTAQCPTHGLQFHGAEGAKELKVHMSEVHGKRHKPVPRLTKPSQWKTPSRTAGGLDKVLANVEAGKYLPLGGNWPTDNYSFVEVQHVLHEELDLAA